jgi:hypothetical protein
MRSTRLSGNRHRARSRHAVMRGREASVHSSSGIAADSARRHSCNSRSPSSELSYDAGATGVRTTSIRSAVFHVGAPTSRRGLSATKATSDFPRAGRTRSSTATRMCRCFPTSVLDRTVAQATRSAQPTTPAPEARPASFELPLPVQGVLGNGTLAGTALPLWASDEDASR